VTHGATFQRARSAAHKQLRHATILTAARKLALQEGVRNVSLGDIAREVGLAKSNVLRYFETREEIYLHLTAEGWREWRDAIEDRLGQGSIAPDECAAILSETLAERPLFCDLLAHTPANLEHNVSPDGVRAYKLIVLPAVDELAELITNHVPGLREGAGYDVIALATLLAASLWQVANPPPILSALYAQDPALANACVDFAPTLRRMLTTFINGCATEPH
jgi:AcrR family transcriptional regulator